MEKKTLEYFLRMAKMSCEKIIDSIELEDEIMGNFIELQYVLTETLKELEERPRNKFKSKQVNLMQEIYKYTGYSIKKTQKLLKDSNGIEISDKQLRNILQREGVYRRRERRENENTKP